MGSGLRGSIRVIWVDDLALTKGVVLGIVGHGDDTVSRWNRREDRGRLAVYRTSMRPVKETWGSNGGRHELRERAERENPRSIRCKKGQT